MTRVTYAHDAERRLRAGLVGCGGHAFRNVYPVLRYLPVEIVAVSDLDSERAKSFKDTFGARSAYGGHLEMLEREELDCAFVVTGYDPATLRVTYPRIAADCLAAGVHTWIEKPPVDSVSDVELLRGAVERSGRTLAIGFKKQFAPANARLEAIVDAEEFGGLESLSLRYPQRIPSVDELAYDGDDHRRHMARLGFLDHICHPVSLLQMLAGRAATFRYTRSPAGTGFATFEMRSGAVATIHLAAGQSVQSPLERTEAIGRGANAVVENNTRLTYYRRVGTRGVRHYSAGADFTSEVDDAPVVWEPEWSLGTLYNAGAFLLGYYHELRAFCDAVLDGTPMRHGTLSDAEEGLRIYQAFSRGPGTLVEL